MSKKLTSPTLTVLAICFISLLSACHSSQQFVQPSLSQKVSGSPEYLNNLSIKGPERSLSLSNKRGINAGSGAIDPANGHGLRTKYAAMLKVLPEAIGNLSLYKFIDEWYGVRYRLGGTDKAGIDCSAFMQKLYGQVFGINLLRTAMEQFSMANLIWHKGQCREGDLVFFNIKTSRVSHVGLYLMNNFFVHASSTHGIMISSLDDKYWSRYFACAGRVL
jgi:hypothetical protein